MIHDFSQFKKVLESAKAKSAENLIDINGYKVPADIGKKDKKYG